MKKHLFILFVAAAVAVAAGEPGPKPVSAILVDPTSAQPVDKKTYNGSVKVEYSDGHSEILCKDGKCADPHVSHQGRVGWTHYTHRGNRDTAMNERLIIRFSNGQTKEFKPNPNGGPFIEEWNFVDNDSAVVIKSRGHHGPASFVRYDLASGQMTGHQDGYVEYEKMPLWAQPFSDDIPFGLRSGTDQTGMKSVVLRPGTDQTGMKPVSAEVVPSEAVRAPGNNKVGNIKVTFSDGHSDVVTTDGYCFGPQVSKKGNVSWSHCTGFDRLDYPQDEKLVIRTVDGKSKEFKSESGYAFIRDWRFIQDESAVVIMWGGRHSIPIFLKYNFASGKVTNRVSGIGDYNKLPIWAKVVARGEASLENAPPADSQN